MEQGVIGEYCNLLHIFMNSHCEFTGVTAQYHEAQMTLHHCATGINVNVPFTQAEFFSYGYDSLLVASEPHCLKLTV